MLISVFGRIEHTVGKRKKFGNQYFLLFQRKLSNDFFFFKLTKFKAIADENLNVPQMFISVFYGIENILEKGENGGI